MRYSRMWGALERLNAWMIHLCEFAFTLRRSQEAERISLKKRRVVMVKVSRNLNK